MSASALDAELKRELCAIADRVILLADHTKLGARAPIRVGALSLIDTVVTDAGATKEQRAMLSHAGIEVVIAAVPANEHAS
jgi:DeoR/GlpR family transcriptional regulator of sugar metabolism